MAAIVKIALYTAKTIVTTVFDVCTYPVRALLDVIKTSQLRTSLLPTIVVDSSDPNGYLRTFVVHGIYLTFLPLWLWWTSLMIFYFWIREKYPTTKQYALETVPILGPVATWIRRVIVDRCAYHYPEMECDLRAAFSDCRLPDVHLVPGHSHGYAAGARSSVCQFSRDLAHKLGLEPFSVQLSNQDVRKGVKGVRNAYWIKDTGMSSVNDDIPRRPLFVYIDVEHHMPEFESTLADNFAAHLISTTCPTAAAGTIDNASFTFDKNGRIDVRLSGGGGYLHPLWDWNRDCFLARSYYMGLPLWTSVYKTEKRHVTAHKAIVICTPVVRWFGITGVVAAWVLDHTRLTRFNPVQGGFTRFDVREEMTHKVTVGAVGQFSCATVLVADFEAVGRGYQNSSMKPDVSLCTSWLPNKDRVTAGILFQYFSATANWAERPMTSAIPVSTAHLTNAYTANTTNYGDTPEKPSMVEFMKPLDRSGMTPTNHVINAQWAVKERVVALQDRAATIHLPTDNIVNMLRDCVTSVVDGRALVPLELERVYQNQTRPTQQVILQRAGASGTDPTVLTSIMSSFLKKESYREVKDPRVITTIPGALKVLYATFMMAMSSHLKTFPWYCFKKPREIVGQMTAAASGASFAIEFDVSRMDGNTSFVVRKYIDLPIMLALFPQHAGLLLSLFEKMVNTVGVITGGTRYNTRWSQLSGSPDTSNVNTVRSYAFSYLAFRLYGMTHEQALNNTTMCLFAGDDALTFFGSWVDRQLMVTSYQKASKILGYPIKIKVVDVGNTVTFLGRYYKPWDGNMNSCCDIPRQVSKLHLTVQSSDLNPVKKAVEKAMSFILTDGNTPIIGEWSKAVLDKYKQQAPDASADAARWWSQFASEDQYPNEPQDWYNEVVQVEYPQFQMDVFQAAIAIDPLSMPVCALTLVSDQPTYDVVTSQGIIAGVKGALTQQTTVNDAEIATRGGETQHARSSKDDPQPKGGKRQIRERNGPAAHNARRTIGNADRPRNKGDRRDKPDACKPNRAARPEKEGRTMPDAMRLTANPPK